MVNLWREWKFVLQAIGASLFLLPYAAGQAGLVTFSLLLVAEVWVVLDSMVIFRDLIDKKAMTETDSGDENESEVHYITLILTSLGLKDSKTSRNVLLAVLVLDSVICTTFYFGSLSDIILQAGWLGSPTPAERPGYHLLIHILASCYLIVAEDVTERIGRQTAVLIGKGSIHVHIKDSNMVCEQIEGTTVGYVIVNNEVATTAKDRTEINMLAVVDRLHGYTWKRGCLFFSCVFLVVCVVLLMIQLPEGGDVSEYNYAQCPGFLKPILYAELSWKNVVVTVSVTLFALMHRAIYIPIEKDDVEMGKSEYATAAARSKGIFILIFLIVGLCGNLLLGSSAPALFPTALGSNIYGFNINLTACLIILIAMMLRIMPCCRMLQVFFKLESDSNYWMCVTSLFVLCYCVSYLTPSVLHLAIWQGGVTSNIILVILPRIAYMRRVGYTTAQVLICVAHLLVAFVAICVMWLAMADTGVGSDCRPIFDLIFGDNNSAVCAVAS